MSIDLSKLKFPMFTEMRCCNLQVIFGKITLIFFRKNVDMYLCIKKLFVISYYYSGIPDPDFHLDSKLSIFFESIA